MNYDVSIIIVNYNGKKFLDKLFDSLINLNLKKLQYEIIFVDNNSKDDSVKYLEEKYNSCFNLDLKIYKLKKNLGFAGGNNFGALKASGKYLVFLNNDTYVEKNWLYNLYNFIKVNSCSIVNSKILFYYDFIKVSFKCMNYIILNNSFNINNSNLRLDKKFCSNVIFDKKTIICNNDSILYLPIKNKDKKINLKFNIIQYSENSDYIIMFNKKNKINLNNNHKCSFNFLLNQQNFDKFKIKLIQNAGSDINENYDGYDIGFGEEDTGQYNQKREINSACGAAMIIKKDDFIHAGMFDKRFFMYYEDTDLSFRIRNKGGKIFYCSDAVVYHIHAGSSKEWSPLFVFYVTRNKLLFILKNFSFKVFFRHYIYLIIRTLKTIFSMNSIFFKAALIKSCCSCLFYSILIIFNKNR